MTSKRRQSIRTGILFLPPMEQCSTRMEIDQFSMTSMNKVGIVNSAALDNFLVWTVISLIAAFGFWSMVMS